MTNEERTRKTMRQRVDEVVATLDELLSQHDLDDAEPTMLSDARDRLVVIATQMSDDDGEQHGEIDMSEIVLHLAALGHESFVEQTGGGVATLYVKPLHVDEHGDERYAACAGPGWFAGDGWTRPRAARVEFYVGRDDDGESEAKTITDESEHTIAVLLAEIAASQGS